MSGGRAVDAVSCTRCSVEGAVVRGAAPYAKLASANYASSSGVVDVAAVAAVGAYSSRSLPTVAIRDDRYRPANSAYSVGGRFWVTVRAASLLAGSTDQRRLVNKIAPVSDSDCSHICSVLSSSVSRRRHLTAWKYHSLQFFLVVATSTDAAFEFFVVCNISLRYTLGWVTCVYLWLHLGIHTANTNLRILK